MAITVSISPAAFQIGYENFSHDAIEDKAASSIFQRAACVSESGKAWILEIADSANGHPEDTVCLSVSVEASFRRLPFSIRRCMKHQLPFWNTLASQAINFPSWRMRGVAVEAVSETSSIKVQTYAVNGWQECGS